MYGIREFIAYWWRAPSDYRWTLRHLRALGLLQLYKVLIGTLTLTYGLAAAFSLAWSVVDRGPVLAARPAVLAIALAAAAMAMTWFFAPPPTERMSGAFAIVADISVVFVMLCYADAFTAMPGLALLGCNAMYIISLHGPRAVLAHLVYSSVALSYFYALAIHQGHVPSTLLTVRGLVLLPIVVLLPIFVQSYLLSLRAGAVDALHDPLTRLCNRRGLDYFLEEMSSRLDTAVTAVVVDIDRFKAINDALGHGAGDRVLVAVAEALRESASAGCLTFGDTVIARTGGDEFTLVMRDGRDVGARFAERLHDAVKNSDNDFTPTLSVGMASIEPAMSSRLAEVRRLMQRADQAMYEAKHAGGAQTVVAERINGSEHPSASAVPVARPAVAPGDPIRTDPGPEARL